MFKKSRSLNIAAIAMLTTVAGSCDKWLSAPIIATKTSTVSWDEPYKTAVNAVKEHECTKAWQLLIGPAIQGDVNASSIIYELLMNNMSTDGENYKYQDALLFYLISYGDSGKYHIDSSIDDASRRYEYRNKLLSGLRSKSAIQIVLCSEANESSSCPPDQRGQQSEFYREYIKSELIARKYTTQRPWCRLRAY